MSTADMTRQERYAYFAFHGTLVEDARQQFEAAVEAYGKVLKECGAFERSYLTVERFASDLMRHADGPLSEEWKDYLGA